MVGIFILVALLGMLGDPISLFGVVSLPVFWWVGIVAAAYLVAVGVALKDATAGRRRYARFVAVGLAGLFLLSGFLLPGFLPAAIIPGVGAPTALLTIAEGSCFDFPDFSTDGNCATGNAEIAINSDSLIVALDIVGASDANTLTPDSWAVDFTLRCTASCDFEEGGAAFTTPWHARIIGLGDWVIAGNTTTIEIMEKNTDGTWQIAWTDTGSSTIVGFENAGAVASFGDSDSGTFTLTMYMNENGLPKGIPDAGEKYTRTAIVNIFSPRGGTSFNVQIDLVLTNDT